MRQARGRYSATEINVTATDSPGKDQKVPARIRRVRRLLARVTRRRLVQWWLSSINGLTINDEAIYSVACHAQSNDGQNYIGVGKLNGQPV